MDNRKRRSIKTMAELESRLRRTNQKQAALYLFCNFISLMLMTAYSGLMFSPTVQDIFPPGGDSRKQLYAIFVLALFGCVMMHFPRNRISPYLLGREPEYTCTH